MLGIIFGEKKLFWTVRVGKFVVQLYTDGAVCGGFSKM